MGFARFYVSYSRFLPPRFAYENQSWLPPWVCQCANPVFSNEKMVVLFAWWAKRLPKCSMYGWFTYMKGETWPHSREISVNLPVPWSIWVTVLRNIWVFPKNRGTPKSSILRRFSIGNHPFWGTPILETSIGSYETPKPTHKKHGGLVGFQGKWFAKRSSRVWLCLYLWFSRG